MLKINHTHHFTPDQQYLADTVSLNKSVGDNSACCLNIGGIIETDDEGSQICITTSSSPSQLGQTSFYLDQSCAVASSVAEDEPSSGNQTNGDGGFFQNINWGGLGDFVNEFAETTLPVFFPPNQPPTSIGGGGGFTPPPPTDEPPIDEKKGISTKGIVAIVVTVLTLAIAVYFIRRR